MLLLGEKLQEVVSYLQFSKLHLKDYNVRLLLEKWPRILCSIRDQVGKVICMWSSGDFISNCVVVYTLVGGECVGKV